jgi:hypothetical protein
MMTLGDNFYSKNQEPQTLTEFTYSLTLQPGKQYRKGDEIVLLLMLSEWLLACLSCVEAPH